MSFRPALLTPRRLTIVALWLSLCSGPVLAGSDVVVPSTELVAGLSQTEWSSRWWQWAFSFERVRSPIADKTGALCASRQTGELWFLAGTYGSHRVERTCTVPAGKTLFFPLINYVVFRAEGSKESCMQMAARVTELVKHPSALILDIDGVKQEQLQTHRLTTPCFSVVPGQTPDAVADGYYVALRPLARGKHTLNFGGILPDLMQAVTYELTVE